MNGQRNRIGKLEKTLFERSDVETAKKVGSRHGKPVIYQIDCRKIAEDGFLFYLSANRVWLTKAVPAEYLSKME